MRIGLVFPNDRIGTDPAEIANYARRAEELGFTHLLTYDHVLGAEQADREPPLPAFFDESSPFHEPLVLFSYLAGVTTALEFACGILVLPQRPVALVAKQAATLGILSGGRFRLGVGTGWNYVEYEALGTDFASRGERLEEQVGLLRRLWSEPVVTHHSESARIERAGICPLPSAPIPIWFGGHTGVAMRRAARLGEGFIWGHYSGLDLSLIDAIRREAESFGRDPASLGFECVLETEPTNWPEVIDLFARAGGTHVALRAELVAEDLLEGLATTARRLGSRLG